MLLCRHRVKPALVVGSRGVVDTKLHRRRKEWEAKTYPHASTNEPNQLPRRGRRGGWMQNPAMGVAKLDGTNIRQKEWWGERSEEVDKDFIAQVQAAAATGKKHSMQEIFDNHLEQRDALKVAMPSANDFLQPHIKRLADTPKPNPVHEEATQGLPPLADLPEQPPPPFIDESLKARRTRRGRFLGTAKGDRQGGAADSFENAPKVPGLSQSAARAAGWSENSELEDDTSGRGRKSSRNPETDEIGDVHNEARQPMDSMEPTRHTALGDFWSSHGASWVVFNSCMVPSTFPPTERELVVGTAMTEYMHTRSAASLFDVSYKVGLRILGVDREFVADQFLTCNLRAMRVGDVQYACVLDTKGLVLDDAFVYLSEDSVEILLSGCHSRQLVDYLGQYVVHVRRSGADVSLMRSPRTVSLALQGPQACDALKRTVARLTSEADDGCQHLVLETASSSTRPLSPNVFADMPFMSYLRLGDGKSRTAGDGIVVLRAGSTGEDGFEILATPGDDLLHVVGALLEDASVRPAGVYCLDMLRMEAGLPRIGSDIPAGTVSPIRASLAWVLDQSKMRSHLMFGWEKLFFQLAKGPKYRRVGIILDGPAHGGCYILSNPHRQPIGQITTTAWSPALQARVAMAYVKPEYAKANKHVLITVPYNLPIHKMRRDAIRRWTRQGNLRSAYRRLVAACVVPLPLVPHKYPEPKRQRKALAQQRPFAPEGLQTFSEQLHSAKSGGHDLENAASSTSSGTRGKFKHPQPLPPAGRRQWRKSDDELSSDMASV